MRHDFGNTRTLPCFETETSDIGNCKANGYEELGRAYNGTTNKVEIQPYRYGMTADEPIFVPLGVSYTIGERFLCRLVVAQIHGAFESHTDLR